MIFAGTLLLSYKKKDLAGDVIIKINHLIISSNLINFFCSSNEKKPENDLLSNKHLNFLNKQKT